MHPDVFSFGEYIPLPVEGEFAEHVICFSRRLDRECVIAVVPQNFYRLLQRSGGRKSEAGPPTAKWNNTSVVVPDDFPHVWQCELSGQCVEHATDANDSLVLEVAKLFDVFPVALLKSSQN